MLGSGRFAIRTAARILRSCRCPISRRDFLPDLFLARTTSVVHQDIHPAEQALDRACQLLHVVIVCQVSKRHHGFAAGGRNLACYAIGTLPCPPVDSHRRPFGSQRPRIRLGDAT